MAISGYRITILIMADIELNIGAKKMEELLGTNSLSQCWPPMEELGHNSYAFFTSSTLDQVMVEGWCNEVGIKSGHGQRLVAAWKITQGRSSMPTSSSIGAHAKECDANPYPRGVLP